MGRVASGIVSAVLAALFITAGTASFLGLMNEQFEAWGHPPGVPAMVGILEIFGGICLLFRRAAGWAALGLMMIMIGAIWTHAIHRQYVEMITPIVVLTALAFVARTRRHDWSVAERSLEAAAPARDPRETGSARALRSDPARRAEQ
jgi:putative oxidoreductase